MIELHDLDIEHLTEILHMQLNTPQGNLLGMMIERHIDVSQAKLQEKTAKQKNRYPMGTCVYY